MRAPFNGARYEHTHWHPDQPDAPTVQPDESWDPTDQDPPSPGDYREGSMPHASHDGEARIDPRLLDQKEN